ncbi:type I 3-dehydroquinate dehydratase [Neobacillus niacini]|uniref:type I 3-dehydroquinate dehydratase n=1 Tax=Neobacillus niacini TaxID=86668 RepID=UPI0021CB0530|nr:type I 3-dehydroquinate dehydratase [Neobacillus niacini]MCM3764851.1 type I 3-dehydroquinate dehydratase [Neobacillus niacini]
MKKVIKVRGITIGEGAPKICVPLVGRTLTDLIEEAQFLKTLEFDLVEWRVDFFENVEQIEKVKDAFSQIRTILNEAPIIFTFRSKREGGEKEVSNQFYFELNKAVAQSGLADFIDVELFNEENDIQSLIEYVHKSETFIIVSNHDFNKTPPKEEIVARLCRAQELGGDIPKIAVMPSSMEDVLTLLDATNTMYKEYADRPIITISMGGQGLISRMAGEVFGSSITFASAKKASAPGQVAVEELKRVLNILHSNL